MRHPHFQPVPSYQAKEKAAKERFEAEVKAGLHYRGYSGPVRVWAGAKRAIQEARSRIASRQGSAGTTTPPRKDSRPESRAAHTPVKKPAASSGEVQAKKPEASAKPRPQSRAASPTAGFSATFPKPGSRPGSRNLRDGPRFPKPSASRPQSR